MNIKYKVIKSKRKDGKTLYGIGILKYYSDVFERKKDADAFAKLCNDKCLSETHFDNVIEDYINR